MIRDIPRLLSVLDETPKFDCKPAQNAFKETWAHWLILNEKRIEENEDVNQLISDLGKVLDQRQTELVQGKSPNFYDHTRQALGRMYLHENDHSKDCGTLTAWNKAIDADPAYKAVAVYNKAYIVINMGNTGYMDEAISLLKETIDCVDVHVAEAANTMMASHISAAHGKFSAHNKGETNFKRQLEIRNSFFKMWLDYTDKAISKLEELKKDGEDAITEEKGIFALVEKPSHLEASELQELFNAGLQVVYEVKKKPRFCIDALVCALIGLLQVFAGVLVCGLTFGAAAYNFGMGLINEGISDLLAGVKGMIKGSFNWQKWAISKAINIGMSLLTGGFKKIKDTFCAVGKGVKDLLTGTKSLSSFAQGCTQGLKYVWTSLTQQAMKEAGTAIASSPVASLALGPVAKVGMMLAGKSSIREVLTEGLMQSLDVTLRQGTEHLFTKFLTDWFKSEIKTGFQDSKEMDDCLTRLVVCYGVPVTTLHAENPQAYNIPNSNQTMIHKQIKDICERVMPELTTDNGLIQRLFTEIQQVKVLMKDVLDDMAAPGEVITAVSVLAEIGKHTTDIYRIIQNIPTQGVMVEKVVPEFKEDIDMLLNNGDAQHYINDDRSSFPAVKQMKEKLLNTLTERVATAFTDACISNLNSFWTDLAKTKLNERVIQATQNLTGRYETKYNFQKKQELYHIEKLKSSTDDMNKNSIPEPDLNELTSMVRKIEGAEKAPSFVELKAMTESGQLGGKGLEIQTVDDNGKELSSVAFKGTDNAQGTIKLRVTRENVQTEG